MIGFADAIDSDALRLRHVFLEMPRLVLANPEDDRTKMVFDASVRRHTDQFLFRFKKPR